MLSNQSVLLRFPDKDTELRVSKDALDKLANILGLNRTEVVHLALREFADKRLPRYELDEGPLTDEQLEAISKASPVSGIKDSDFDEVLF